MGHGLTTAAFVLALGISGVPPAARGERMSLPDCYLGHRMQPLLLLTRADVRADVGLNAAQAEAVDNAVPQFVARAAAIRGLAGPSAQDARRAVDDEAQRWLEAHLDEKQYKRLVEVDLQWEGPSSLISRPILAEHLELTPDQKTRLAQAVATRNQQRRPGTFNQSLEKALANQALTILTRKQQDLWFAMQGRRFSPQFTDTAQSAARTSP